MPDIRLTADGDLDVSGGDLSLTNDTNGETVKQRVGIRLRWHYGEWFLDNRKGVKWLERVFVKSPDLSAIEVMLRSTIIATEGVLSLDSYSQSFDKASRQMTVTWRATATDGTTISNTEVL